MKATFKPIAASHDPLAGYGELSQREFPWIAGYIKVGPRSIPVAKTRLSARDRLGAVKVRLGFGRDNYRVLPGLYAVGSPTGESPVLVTANYKLSLDALRRELGGIDAWILVLDTKGVNVWCAAGKGSFGTAELLSKIASARLGDIVSHNLLILPQLGATGVSAPEIARRSRFRVVWGPVRASDLRAFLGGGMKATAEMRRVRFGLKERLSVAPVELTQAWPILAAALVVSALLALPLGPASWARFGIAAWVLAGSVLEASFLFPALLPILPFEAFSLKGAFLGLLWGGLSAIAGGAHPGMVAASAIGGAAISAFIAMGFTGASTFTCQAGAAAEVEKGLPWMIGGALAAAALGTAARILGF
jgi:hypothetical protein